MGVHLEVVCLLQAAEIERLGNDLKELTMKYFCFQIYKEI